MPFGRHPAAPEAGIVAARRFFSSLRAAGPARVGGLAVLALQLFLLPAEARCQEELGPQAPAAPAALRPPAVPAELDRDSARKHLDEALTCLLREQRPDGSWGSAALEGQLEMGFSVETYYAWQFASHGLALLALLRLPETPELRRGLDRGIDWLLETRVPARGSNWDIDYSWSALYGFVALVDVLADPRFQQDPRRPALEQALRVQWALLERNESSSGGWAYYDDPPFARRPNWATSFCTALVLPAIENATRRGWIDGRDQVRRGLAALRRSALPNGAYTYDVSDAVPRITGGEHINQVKGSLGRIQVCNWARAVLGDPEVTPEDLRRGLTWFFEHHKFLDVAFMRPVPHEAYYANAGYFYLFAHFYAAEVIELLPAPERESWHRRLRPHLAKIQRPDGSSTDFLGTSYLRTGGTAMAAYALMLGLDDPE